MSQVRKLQGGGNTTFDPNALVFNPDRQTTQSYHKGRGSLTIDGKKYDMNDQDTYNALNAYIRSGGPKLGRFLGDVTNAIEQGKDISVNTHLNRIYGLENGFSNLNDRENKRSREGRSEASKILGTLFDTNVNQSNEAIWHLGRFNYSKPTTAELNTIMNDAVAFNFDTVDGKKVYSESNPINKYIFERFPHYWDWLDDEETWNKTNKWSDKNQDAILRSWYKGLGEDNATRRAAAQAAVDAAINDVKQNGWDGASEANKELLAYFNIGTAKSTVATESGETDSNKSKWTAAGYNNSLYDLLGGTFTLNDDGTLTLNQGQTFNLGDWHNGRNIYFNDDFYNSEYGVDGRLNALRGLTYYNGVLYNLNNPTLKKILDVEGGFNSKVRSGDWAGADDIIMTRFTPAARENYGRLDKNRYAKFFVDNPNYIFQNLTGGYDIEGGLGPREQLVQYADLNSPIESDSPYVEYNTRYAILDNNGNFLRDYEGPVNQIQDGTVRDFSAYNRIYGTDSPYEGMYYTDYQDASGQQVPIRIYRDPANPNQNVILHIPNINASGVDSGMDLRLPAEVAEIISNNKNFIGNVATNKRNLNNFQSIISRLIQSRTNVVFGKSVVPFSRLFSRERKQLVDMGFSPEDADKLIYFLDEYSKSNNRLSRRSETLVRTPVMRKMGGKVDYIEKLAKGGVSGGTTKTTSSVNRVSGAVKNTSNAASLSEMGGSEWLPADTADVVALLADLSAAGITFIDPTNIGGAAAGTVGSFARFAADKMRPETKGAGWNLAMNLGMDAITLLPVVGDTVQAANVAKGVRKALPTIIKAASLFGMGDAVKTTATKIANGEKFTVRDLDLIANALTAGLAMYRVGGFGKPKFDSKPRAFSISAKQSGKPKLEFTSAQLEEIKTVDEMKSAILKQAQSKDNKITAENLAEHYNIDDIIKGVEKWRPGLNPKTWFKKSETGKIKFDVDPVKSEAKNAWQRFWRGEGDKRAAYLAQFRGEPPVTTTTTTTTPGKNKVYTRRDIVEAPGTTPGGKYYKDEFGTSYRKGDVKVSEITAEQMRELQNKPRRVAINDEAGNFSNMVDVTAVRPGVPVTTTTKTPVKTWNHWAIPQILGFDHSRTDYTYEPLPSLVYQPIMHKKGGVIKGQNGLHTLNSGTGLYNFRSGVGSNYNFNLSDGTMTRTNPNWTTSTFTNGTPTWSLGNGIVDYTTVRTPRVSNNKNPGNGGHNRNINSFRTAVENSLGMADFATSLLYNRKYYDDYIDAIEAGRHPIIGQRLQQYRTDSSALQQARNQIIQRSVNGIKPKGSDLKAYYAAKNYADAVTLQALNENTAQQAQYQQQMDLQNTQIANQQNAIDTDVANKLYDQNAAIESAKGQAKMIKTQADAQSLANKFKEVRSQTATDSANIQNIEWQLEQMRQNKMLNDLLENDSDYVKWTSEYNSLPSNERSKYLSMDAYAKAKYGTAYDAYRNKRLGWEQQIADNLVKWQIEHGLTGPLGGLGMEVTSSAGYKKGGTLRGSTRYTKEPDEQIWIDQNKATHRNIGKLNDNIIKLLLRALK